MNNKLRRILLMIILLEPLLSFGQNQVPYLQKKGSATQLIVNEKPFLILGGELGNSTATTMESMESVWPKLKAMHLNTVLIPVFWELVEPQEGLFDFSLAGNLINEARKHDLKIIFLWFGSWKNSMSSHAPAWIKLNSEKYPRAKNDKGDSQEILTPFSENVLNADKKAFENLMHFIKEFDSNHQTVIMVQVENEIGMLPSARDHHPLAGDKFVKNVPAELMRYLEQNRKNLVPEFREIWANNGFKASGNWEDVFGAGLHTDEIFMAWHYAVFANELARAGKKIYPLPMFVNAALNYRGRKPGEYPSAGPLPHLADVWKAAGNAIDFMAPDFYNPDFKHWCDLYTRQGNPLFVPEHVFDKTVAAKALYAVSHYEGLGFAPFSIESTENPADEPLGKMYALIENIKPLIAEHAGNGKIKGVLASKTEPETVIQLGEYELTCRHDYTLSWTPGARLEDWPSAAALFIQTGENEFFIAGNGIVTTFKHIENNNLNVGLLKVDEGWFENDTWKIYRHLNGDQIHQGRHVSIPAGQFLIQRVKLYTYQ